MSAKTMSEAEVKKVLSVVSDRIDRMVEEFPEPRKKRLLQELSAVVRHELPGRLRYLLLSLTPDLNSELDGNPPKCGCCGGPCEKQGVEKCVDALCQACGFCKNCCRCDDGSDER